MRREGKKLSNARRVSHATPEARERESSVPSNTNKREKISLQKTNALTLLFLRFTNMLKQRTNRIENGPWGKTRNRKGKCKGQARKDSEFVVERKKAPSNFFFFSQSPTKPLNVFLFSFFLEIETSRWVSRRLSLASLHQQTHLPAGSKAPGRVDQVFARHGFYWFF